jgi:hypothetical protein
LPERASGAVRMIHGSSGVGVEFSLDGATDARPSALGMRARDRVPPALRKAIEGSVTFPGAAPGAGDVIHRPRRGGTEDSVFFAARPKFEELRYTLDVRRAAGLRLVANTLEFVDGGGAPRIRVAPPFFIGDSGKRKPASIAIEGCDVDKNPSAPFGRPPTPPGAAACTMRVAWSAEHYPIVVDPAWTFTSLMVAERHNHVANLLPNGQVLVTAGYRLIPGETYDTEDDSALTEIYDPPSNAWATSGALKNARTDAVSATLGNGKVLIASGVINAYADPSPFPTYLASTELYDPATGMWIPTNPLSNARAYAAAALLPDGRVLIAGGIDNTGTLPSSETFDPMTSMWTPAGAMPNARAHYGAVLVNGQVLAVGGTVGGKECDLFDPATNNWSPTDGMAVARKMHAVALAGGKAVVVGGVSTPKDVQVYDPATGKWGAPFQSPLSHANPVGVTLADGRALFSAANTSYEAFDAAVGSWAPIADGLENRSNYTLTLLTDGRVLAAAGDLTGTAEVLYLRPLGTPCTDATECASGRCIDGVCCDTSCAGVCEACTAAKKGGGADGQCAPIQALTDPEDECTEVGVATCGTTGFCDGAGACALYAAGTVCVPPACGGGKLVTSKCDGAANCVQSKTDCGAYACQGASACATSCFNDASCAPGTYCVTATSTCEPKNIDGTACTAPHECTSGHCVEGVCCNTSCNGACMACTAKNKASGADGTCALAKEGSDPHDDCKDDGATSCKHDGTCDGQGACRLYSLGTACGATECVGNVQTGYACDGSGVCVAGTEFDCGAYLCKGETCDASCGADTDCADGAYCDAQQCAKKKKNGATCTVDHACKSGFCVDGFCCDSACSGQCEACDIDKGEGTCAPLAGPPHGKRPACNAGSAADPCSKAACDGVLRESCAGFVGSAVECSPADCKDGVEYLRAGCDGKGACSKPIEKPCAPYGCGATVCNSQCSGAADCAPGSECVSGACSVASTCRDDQTVVSPTGTTTNCAPYKCADGRCKDLCASVFDCTSPNVCNQGGACVPPPNEDPTADSGCGFARSSGRASEGAWLVLLTALAGTVRTRRRVTTYRRSERPAPGRCP